MNWIRVLCENFNILNICMLILLMELKKLWIEMIEICLLKFFRFMDINVND